MNAKVMAFASALCIIGLAMFFHGTSLSSQVMDAENLISGTFLVVVGIFVGLAGFLMLILQMFQRQSLSY
ncbi:MAG: hypothetical protein PVI43_05470 [Candidatus Bathyarchaeota archaeon]|jgi:hypothetical protein